MALRKDAEKIFLKGLQSKICERNLQVQLYQLRASSEKPPFVVELEVGEILKFWWGMTHWMPEGWWLKIELKYLVDEAGSCKLHLHICIVLIWDEMILRVKCGTGRCPWVQRGVFVAGVFNNWLVNAHPTINMQFVFACICFSSLLVANPNIQYTILHGIHDVFLTYKLESKRLPFGHTFGAMPQVVKVILRTV